MSVDDRMDRLEQRVAVLETLVRRRSRRRGRRAPADAAARRRAGKSATAGHGSVAAAPSHRHRRPRRPRPSSPSLAASPPPVRRPRSRPPSSGSASAALLAIGVFALLLAAGLSAQAVVRARLDLAGDALHRRRAGGRGRGRHRLAAARRATAPTARRSSAAGAGIIYLSVWAACRLYGVLPSTTGIVGLALVSRRARDDRATRSTSRRSARPPRSARSSRRCCSGSRPGQRRTCCCSISPAWPSGSGWSRRAAAGGSRRSSSRRATSASGSPAPPSGRCHGRVLLYGVVGGTAGLYLGLRERWWETRLLTFSGGWCAARRRERPAGAALADLGAAVVLAAPVWWHALRSPRVLPLQLRPLEPAGGWRRGRRLVGGRGALFFLTPLLLGWAVRAAGTRPVRRNAGPAAAAGRRDSLPAGRISPAAAGVRRWSGRRRSAWPSRATVGRPAAGLRPARARAGLGRARSQLNGADGRWYGLVTLVAALQYLFDEAARIRDRERRGVHRTLGAGALGRDRGDHARSPPGSGAAPDAEETRVVRVGLWMAAGADGPLRRDRRDPPVLRGGRASPPRRPAWRPDSR